MDYKLSEKIGQILNGKALFFERACIDDLEKLPKASFVEPVYSKCSGYVQDINAKEIGKLVAFLGAGREKKEDNIDLSVGIVLNKKVSDYVEKNEIIGYVHANDLEKMEYAKNKLIDIMVIEIKC